MGVPSSLARLPLFTDLTEAELLLLKDNLRTLRLGPSETLFNEGDRAGDCFILLDGRVAVFHRLPDGKEERLTVLGAGALIGHVALIDGKPRSATCRAENKPVFLIVIPRAVFEELFNAGSGFAFKIVDKIAKDLVRRLRKTTDKLAAAKAEDTMRRSALTKSCVRETAVDIINDRVSEMGLSNGELDEISFEISEGQG